MVLTGGFRRGAPAERVWTKHVGERWKQKGYQLFVKALFRERLKDRTCKAAFKSPRIDAVLLLKARAVSGYRLRSPRNKAHKSRPEGLGKFGKSGAGRGGHLPLLDPFRAAIA
jgi:hypothetical protein